MHGKALRHDATESGSRTTLRTVELAPGTIWATAPEGRTITVMALDGALWITQTAGERDLILRRGEMFTSRGEGRVVIEAITATAMFGIVTIDRKQEAKRAGLSEMIRAYVRQMLAGRRTPRRESYCN